MRVERLALLVVQVVALVVDHEVHGRALGEERRLVDDDSAARDLGADRHEGERSTGGDVVDGLHVVVQVCVTPRWQHRDCAGLVRFAVAEALRPHDLGWRQANAIAGRVPPDLTLSPEQQLLRHRWRLADGSTSAFVGALELIQENAVFVAKDINQAQPGDLLFFDQGDDQHLMVWTGGYIGYHTGTSSQSDNGLRAVSVRELMSWRDTRWQPVRGNPNFAGVYRLRFLSR